jgi:flagellar biosynthesis GTPase FlhF
MSATEGNSPNRARGYKRRRDSASPSYFDKLNGPAETSSAQNGNDLNGGSSSKARDAGRADGPSSWDTKDDDDNYTPYVPLSKRRANLISSLHNKSSSKHVKTKTIEEEADEREAAKKAEEEAEENRREKARKERTLLQEAQEVKKQQAEQGEYLPLLRPVMYSGLIYHSSCTQDGS